DGGEDVLRHGAPDGHRSPARAGFRLGSSRRWHRRLVAQPPRGWRLRVVRRRAAACGCARAVTAQRRAHTPRRRTMHTRPAQAVPAALLLAVAPLAAQVTSTVTAVGPIAIVAGT